MSECLSEGGGKRKRPFFIQGGSWAWVELASPKFSLDLPATAKSNIFSLEGNKSYHKVPIPDC